MKPRHPGSFHLFRYRGIDVYVHWMWFVAAYFLIQFRQGRYDSVVWAVYEYLALFGIVLLHEFGHSLACRQVGGVANRIVLWPLGGVAFVSPPPRPGAVLWSIAAGPLVNVALIPVLYAIGQAAPAMGLRDPDVLRLIANIAQVNLVLLIFNMLPIYPLDGGQIFQSLLWFVIGRSKSLYVATVVGALLGVGVLAYAWQQQSLWLGVIGVFILMRCKAGFDQARIFSQLDRAPQRSGLACPICHAPPPTGAHWVCQGCGGTMDAFSAGGDVCPRCGVPCTSATCPSCQRTSPLRLWRPSGNAPVVEVRQ